MTDINELKKKWHRRLVVYIADRVARETGQLNQSELRISSSRWINESKIDNLNPDKYYNFLNEISEFITNLTLNVSTENTRNDKTYDSSDWRYYVKNWIISDTDNLIPKWFGEPVLQSDASTHIANLGHSEQWKTVVSQFEISCKSSVTTLITGESGAGKDLIARKLHDLSDRKYYPFVIVPCAALAFDWLSFEWFGNNQNQTNSPYCNISGNWFRRVKGGTLYLDHIENTPPEAQELLLRFIESLEEFESTKNQANRTKIIASSVIPVKQLVETDRLREDLYHRLNVFDINIPPLRERKEDILPLVYYLSESIAKRHNMIVPVVDKSTLKYLKSLDLNGNIRELATIIEREILTSDGMSLKFEPQSDQVNEKVVQRKTILVPGYADIYDQLYKSKVINNKILLSDVAQFFSENDGQDFKSSSFAEETNISVSKARKILAELSENGILTKNGSKKGTTYCYNSSLYYASNN